MSHSSQAGASGHADSHADGHAESQEDWLAALQPESMRENTEHFAEKRISQSPALAHDAAGYAARVGRIPRPLAVALARGEAWKQGQPHRLVLVTGSARNDAVDRFVAAAATFSRTGELQMFTLAAEMTAVPSTAVDPAAALVDSLAGLTAIGTARYGAFFNCAVFADASGIDTNVEEIVAMVRDHAVLGAIEKFDVLETVQRSDNYEGANYPRAFASALFALTLAVECVIRELGAAAPWAPNAHWDPFIAQIETLRGRFLQLGKDILGYVLPQPDWIPAGLRLGLQRVYDAPNEAVYQWSTELSGYDGPETLEARILDQLFGLAIAGVPSLLVGFIYGAGFRYREAEEPAELSAAFRGAVDRDRYAREEVIKPLAVAYKAMRALADDVVNEMSSRLLGLIARCALLKQVYSLRLLLNRGRSLQQLPAADVLKTAADGVAWLAQLSFALTALHANKICHGDIHAGNLCYQRELDAYKKPVLVVLTPHTAVSAVFAPVSLIDLERTVAAHWRDFSAQKLASRAVLRIVASLSEPLLTLPLETLTSFVVERWGATETPFVLAAFDDFLALFGTLASYARGTPAARVCADANRIAQEYFVGLLQKPSQGVPAAASTARVSHYGAVHAMLEQVFAGHAGELKPPAAYESVFVAPVLLVADRPPEHAHFVDTPAAPGINIVEDLLKAGETSLGGGESSGSAKPPTFHGRLREVTDASRAARESEALVYDDDAGYSIADAHAVTRAFDDHDELFDEEKPDEALEAITHALENIRAAATPAW